MQATQTIINGINVPKLFETIDLIKSDGSLANFIFRASDQWITCGHNRFTVLPFHGANQENDRPNTFTFDVDEPPLLLGNDQGPNPVEFGLGSLLGCLTNTLAYHAASRGIEIEHIESQVDGDIDIHGFLGLDPNVRCGYQEIRVKLRVKSDADPELLKKLAQYSPMYDTFSNPVRVILDVEKI